MDKETLLRFINTLIEIHIVIEKINIKLYFLKVFFFIKSYKYLPSIK